MRRIVSPARFFSRLRWLDGRPLPDVIEPYRALIFERALWTFDDEGFPLYNLVLAGRAKKNWKSADLVLAALYKLVMTRDPRGADGFLIANDEEQAGDDLTLAKKIVRSNPGLSERLVIRAKGIERRDGRGELLILPARDVVGSHGKTYGFCGWDELHGQKTYDLLEAMAPDPSRPDALTWITSYASLYDRPGVPLHDLCERGRKGEDPKMLLSWYSSSYTTDPHLQDADPETKANPSRATWGNPGYLAQQKRRLPSARYRRLHLNEPGSPEGAFFDAERVMSAVVTGRKRLAPVPDVRYAGFVDMSGGSNDDAVLGIAHRTEAGQAVLDLLVSQTGKAPFNPRDAVKKFAGILREYRLAAVVGDAYAGQTFRSDFEAEHVTYNVSARTKSELYEAAEPRLNAGELELLDHPVLADQLMSLTTRGGKPDHPAGDHDDFANAAVGALVEAAEGTQEIGSIAFALMHENGTVSTSEGWSGGTGGSPWGGFWK